MRYPTLGLDTLAVHWCLPDPGRAWHWTCAFKAVAWQRVDRAADGDRANILIAGIDPFAMSMIADSVESPRATEITFFA